MAVTFGFLKSRLIGYVNYRIRNGEYSERMLARIIGVSQPQLHNVLKGSRALSQDLADRLLRHFHIGCIDLLEPEELARSNEPQPGTYELIRKQAQTELTWMPRVNPKTRKTG